MPENVEECEKVQISGYFRIFCHVSAFSPTSAQALRECSDRIARLITRGANQPRARPPCTPTPPYLPPVN